MCGLKAATWAPSRAILRPSGEEKSSNIFSGRMSISPRVQQVVPWRVPCRAAYSKTVERHPALIGLKGTKARQCIVDLVPNPKEKSDGYAEGDRSSGRV